VRGRGRGRGRGRAGREAVEDDGQQTRSGLLVESLAGGRPRGGDEQRVDLGQADVAADGAGLLRLDEQRADGLAQCVRCPGGVGVLVVVAAGVEQGLGDGDLGRRVGDQVAEEAEERPTRVGRAEQRVRLLAEPVEAPDENGLEQRRLGREVAEDGADADPGPASYLFGRGGLAALAEDLLGRVEDAAAVGAGVDPLRPAAVGLRPVRLGAHRRRPSR
jgi:hypothetical protein